MIDKTEADKKLDQEIAQTFNVAEELDSRLITYNEKFWKQMRERLRKCGIEV